MRSRIAASSVTPAAGSWLSSCSIVRGPMIADVTRGVVDDEGDRQLDQRDAGVVGDLRELLDGLELALVLGQRHVEARGEPLASR